MNKPLMLKPQTLPVHESPAQDSAVCSNQPFESRGELGKDGRERLPPRLGTSSAMAGASLLGACGGGGSNGAGPAANGPDTTGTGGQPAPASASDPNEAAARFLLQAQFSASDADIASVRALGYAGWLERQAAMPLGQTGWDWLNARGYGDVLNPNNYYDRAYPADYMVWKQLMAAPDTWRKRMALALSEYFVVSVSGLDFNWRSHAMAHYWDTLAAHALGNFRDLLEAVTLHVAMGYYLNTRGNKKENTQGRQPDENYAREVMQLFTIGLHQLNPDGTVKTDSAGKPTETYTASDVRNLARVFTGYDVDNRRNADTIILQDDGSARTVGNTAFARLQMVFNADDHSNLAVNFLGSNIPANTPGPAALKAALDTLFNHPNTGPFFCKQMIQRLVTSNPSPAYVARVAAVFANNGAGVRGDLRSVFAAVLLDVEARGSDGLVQPQFGKLREPMLRLAQWARTFGATSPSDQWKVFDTSYAPTLLGQSPLRAPSVFNFFRPGYVPPSSRLSAGAVAPEFQLVTESSVGGYLNFMTEVISTGIHATSDISAPYDAELALVLDASALVRRVNLLLCSGQLSSATQAIMVGALNATPLTQVSSARDKRHRVCSAVLMVMAAPEYLIQK